MTTIIVGKQNDTIYAASDSRITIKEDNGNIRIDDNDPESIKLHQIHNHIIGTSGNVYLSSLVIKLLLRLPRLPKSDTEITILIRGISRIVKAVKEDKEAAIMASCFLIINQNNCFYFKISINEKGEVVKSTIEVKDISDCNGYNAIGSGSEHALEVFNLFFNDISGINENIDDLLNLAIDYAASKDIHSGGKIQIKKINIR